MGLSKECLNLGDKGESVFDVSTKTISLDMLYGNWSSSSKFSLSPLDIGDSGGEGAISSTSMCVEAVSLDSMHLTASIWLDAVLLPST